MSPSEKMAGIVPQRLGLKNKFKFQCHKKVACFTQCCRGINIILTPYDIIRLKNRLQLSLDRHLAPVRLEGDFGVGRAPRKLPQDLDLVLVHARLQLFHLAGQPGEPRYELVDHGGAEKPLPSGHRAHGFHNLLMACRL